ncbi:MAG: adenylate kinase [Elusimicrobia bacterium]|nr:adenylate kinase [Elusimicrobiota bacterium]
MNIILLGYPGSGKGTQAKVLSQKLGLMHFSTGDIFREEISKHSPLGLEAAGYLSGGRLVPDKLVLDLIKSRLAAETRGLLFDGFPRTVEQAQVLDEYLSSRGLAVDMVFFLDLPEQEVVSRLGARRTCVKCGMIYNLLTSAPAKENTCDACGGALALREDDKPEVIKKRIMVYRDQTEPLLAYYKGNGVFSEVKADLAPQAITGQILSSLKTGLHG